METREEPVEELQEYFSTVEVAAIAQNDLNYFGALAVPELCTLDFPDYYIHIWNEIVEDLNSLDVTRNKFPKYALGFPRGFAKTTFVKLLIVHFILFTKKRYILVIGANLKKAQAILADIATILDSDNIQQVWGNWRTSMDRDALEIKKFAFNGRTVILEAAGQGTAIRGSNQGFARPDVMLFDDSQTSDCAGSVVEAAAYRQWFVGTAMKAKSPNGCLYLYLGNMYKDLEITPKSGVYTCMLRNLQLSPSWTSFVVGAILADWTSLWPELFPVETLLEEYQQDMELGQPEVFFAEVLNDPQAKSSYYFDASKISYRPGNESDMHQGNFIVIDPATSKATPDQTCIGYFELFDAVPVFTECHDDKYTSPETVYFAIQLALQKNCSLIVVESTAYQFALCQWFDFVLGQMGVYGLHVVPLYNSTSKNGRILRYMKGIQGKPPEMYFTGSTYSKIISQGAAFNPLKIDNLDDILDCGQMATRVPVEFAHLIAIPGDLQTISRLESGEALTSNYPC